MKFLLIRHGDPDYEKDGLTERGQQEAEALAPFLESLEVKHIYASSMGRAVATAKPTADRLHLPIQQVDWARELHGFFQMTPDRRAAFFNYPGRELRAIAPQPPYDFDYKAFNIFEEDEIRERLTNMEKGINEVFAKFGYIREGARYRMENPSGDVVALFCHDGFGKTLMGYLTGMPLLVAWSSFFLRTSSVTSFVMESLYDDYATPRLISLSDTTHIRLAGLEDNYRGLHKNPMDDWMRLY